MRYRTGTASGLQHEDSMDICPDEEPDNHHNPMEGMAISFPAAALGSDMCSRHNSYISNPFHNQNRKQ